MLIKFSSFWAWLRISNYNIRANFEFYICSRKIGSQRFLPRKKASALPLRAR